MSAPELTGTAALARFAAELKAQDIPAPVMRKTEDLLVDWLGSAVAGKGARAVSFASVDAAKPAKPAAEAAAAAPGGEKQVELRSSAQNGIQSRTAWRS